MKRIPKILFVALFMLALVMVSTGLGLASDTIDTSKLKIGWAQRSMGCPYYKEVYTTAVAECEKMGAELKFLDAEGDILKERANFQDLITMNCDIIFTDPVDAVGSISAVKLANEAGIPVVVIADPLDLSLAPDVKIATTAIGCDYFKGGELAGRLVANLIGQKEVKMVSINGPQGTFAGRDRVKGFVSGMTMYQLENFNTTYINIVGHGHGDWGTESAVVAMEDLLIAYPDINVVVVGSDGMAFGALRVLEEHNKLNDIEFVAVLFDGQKEGVAAILNGDYDGKYLCTTKNWPREYVPLAIQNGIKFLSGEAIPTFSVPPAVLITKENASDYYQPDAIF